ncbi:helix-turn-helix domain-containing protein [Chitinophaga horti]|uniref:Helix-turn-helix domain-containing protein n=1 Tax=Chitinophaga horti TaxID=2920382 RepID=A0ABY6J350_9BACT|nr:helix-turn-helix transcriptional regulator [Chitinophaga horti]UYQ93067.1 helix-turn-helix domain-containing protein [Chitinophaga horti]
MENKVLKQMRLGAKIKKLRELKNITQDYMASRLNLGTTAYGNIERGTVKGLSVERLMSIAEVLGIDFAEIINYDLNKPYHINPGQQREEVPGQVDEFYTSCIIAIIEQGTQDKKMLIALLSNMREANSRLAEAMAEHNKLLHKIYAKQQELVTILQGRK